MWDLGFRVQKSIIVAVFASFCKRRHLCFDGSWRVLGPFFFSSLPTARAREVLPKGAKEGQRGIGSGTPTEVGRE